MSKGLFITFEGPDGAGKTTQLTMVYDWLKEAMKIPVIRTREPGGTPFAEEIRELLLRPRDEEVSYRAELLLFFAARAQHVERVIQPHLDKGFVVLCDRFTDSTYAYQAAGRGLSNEKIEPIEQFTLEGFKPDVTFLFDVSVEESMRRSYRRGNQNRLDAEVEDFFEKVRLALFGRMERDPDRFIMVNGDLPVDQVFDFMRFKIRQLMLEHLKEHIND